MTSENILKRIIRDVDHLILALNRGARHRMMLDDKVAAYRLREKFRTIRRELRSSVFLLEEALASEQNLKAVADAQGGAA